MSTRGGARPPRKHRTESRAGFQQSLLFPGKDTVIAELTENPFSSDQEAETGVEADEQSR